MEKTNNRNNTKKGDERGLSPLTSYLSQDAVAENQKGKIPEMIQKGEKKRLVVQSMQQQDNQRKGNFGSAVCCAVSSPVSFMSGTFAFGQCTAGGKRGEDGSSSEVLVEYVQFPDNQGGQSSWGN
jgi:hypothetical protein